MNNNESMYLPIFLTSIISQQFKDELIIEHESADIWYKHMYCLTQHMNFGELLS